MNLKIKRRVLLFEVDDVYDIVMKIMHDDVLDIVDAHPVSDAQQRGDDEVDGELVNEQLDMQLDEDDDESQYLDYETLYNDLLLRILRDDDQIVVEIELHLVYLELAMYIDDDDEVVEIVENDNDEMLDEMQNDIDDDDDNLLADDVEQLYYVIIQIEVIEYNVQFDDVNILVEIILYIVILAIEHLLYHLALIVL